MYAFTYERPSATADAAKLVKAGGQALAGGQTLLASMKQRLMQPEQLVDLGKIAEGGNKSRPRRCRTRIVDVDVCNISVNIFTYECEF